jgi:hypothetical protein
VIGESSVPSKSDATTWYIKILTSKQGDERFVGLCVTEKIDDGIERD